MIDVKVGDRVYMLKGGGDQVEYAVILWVGQLPPEHVGRNVGLMAGIQFDNAVGKGTGSLGNKQYFHARDGHAAFVPAAMLHKVNADSLSLFSSSYTSSPNNEHRRQLANISNSIRPSSSNVNGYRNFDIGDKNNATTTITSTPPGGRPNMPNPIGARPATVAPIGTRPAGTPTAAAAAGEYSMFGAGRGIGGGGGGGGSNELYDRGLATSTSGSTRAATTTTTGSGDLSVYFGAGYSKGGVPTIYPDPGKDEEEEVFESDDDLDEALKVDDGEISSLAKKMKNMPTPSTSPSSSPESEPKPKADSPDLKKQNIKAQSNNNNNNNGSSIITKNTIATSVPPASPPGRSSSMSPPPAEAPTASTEWSVVVSKIKKAPKQVRDQLKPPEKKPVPVAKPRTKVEKLLEDNPKYKSTLCSWYIQGARCPNGNECHFAHGEHELRAIPRPKYKYKTQVCSYYAAGHCGNGSTCHFAHGLGDLQKKM